LQPIHILKRGITQNFLSHFVNNGNVHHNKAFEIDGQETSQYLPSMWGYSLFITFRLQRFRGHCSQVSVFTSKQTKKKGLALFLCHKMFYTTSRQTLITSAIKLSWIWCVWEFHSFIISTTVQFP